MDDNEGKMGRVLCFVVVSNSPMCFLYRNLGQCSSAVQRAVATSHVRASAVTCTS